MLIWISRRLQRRNDDGFTLMEVIVAMMVLAIGLLGLMAVQASSIGTIGLAKQRQAGSQLANRLMEQMRALPYGVVTGGMYCGDLSAPTADPNLTGISAGAGGACSATFNPTYDPSISEALVTTSSSSQIPPLNPHVQAATTTKIGNVQYTLRAYVTKVTAPAGVDQGYWLTVISTWKSAVTKNVTKSIAARSRLYSPAGCLATTTHPFSGPCQAFLYTNAGSVGGGVTVSSTRTGLPIVDGITTTAASVAMVGMSTRVQSEQIVSAQSDVTTSGRSATAAGVASTGGGAVATSAADTDPSTGVTTSPGAASTVSQTAGYSYNDNGGGQQFSASGSNADTGSTYSTMTATASPACGDDAGAAISTGQACSTSAVQPAGTLSSSLGLSEVSGRPMTLAEVAAPNTPWRAFGARYVAATAAHCAGTTGAGCVAAGASRTLGTAKAGGIPRLQTGDVVRNAAGTDVSSAFGATSPVLVTITNYSDRATSEAGVGPASPGISRTGTLTYWNGTSFATVSLGLAGASYTVPQTTATYGTTTVSVAGTVVVGAASASTTGSTPCQSAACTTKATTGSVVATFTYAVYTGGTQTGGFTVTLDLGSALSKTTYKAAPLA